MARVAFAKKARKARTARKSFFPGTINGSQNMVKDHVQALKDYEHESILSFIGNLFSDDNETAIKVTEVLTSNYIKSMKQLISMEMPDYSELGFPLGIKKKIHEGVNDYCDAIMEKQNSLEDNQYFSVEREGDEIMINIRSQTIRQNVKNILSYQDDFMNHDTSVSIGSLIRIAPNLQQSAGYTIEDESLNKLVQDAFRDSSAVANNAYMGLGVSSSDGSFDNSNPMHHLLKFIFKEFENELNKTKQLIKRGYITYEWLWYLFKIGMKVVCLDETRKKTLEGKEVVSSNGSNYMGGYSPQFQVSHRSILSNGKFFTYRNGTNSINKFKGEKRIIDLEVAPVEEDSEIYKTLYARGKQFAELAIGHHYLHYEGLMCRERFWTTVDENATGRVMVDISACNKMNGSSSFFGSNKSSFGGQTLGQAMGGLGVNSFETLPEKMYYMAPCLISGFSFVNKRWGVLDIAGLSEIKFRRSAFDLLVLDRHKKDVIKALVTHSDKAFSDMIENKGKGCIFLLHGAPGVGKTLTAEAIAEYLERPLYAVSVGELGTVPQTLEKNLSDILELAGIWNAVVLVDEADIFLERRSESDIIRNAMVGVFLRVVEYFSGVLFLTSNRVRSLDRAFHSRVSVALKYPDLDKESRMKIWKHFLMACGLKNGDDINMDTLGTFDVNGRQIRSTIRLASSLAYNDFERDSQTMSDSKDPVLSMKHITDCVSISNQFSDFVASTSLVEMLSNASAPPPKQP